MKKLKAILGISAIAGAIAAVFAYMKKREMEEYDYYEEEFDECFCDDCCYPDEEAAEEAIKEASEAEDLAEEVPEEEVPEEAPEKTDESTAPEAEADMDEE